MTPHVPSSADGQRAQAVAASQVSSLSWRREPEIAPDRQQYLAERQADASAAGDDAHPFSGEKLARADVEWLLATLDGIGPVQSSEPSAAMSPTVESHWARRGLDLYGADLRGLDLSGLPLGRLRAGQAHLEYADLSHAHLNEAELEGAYLIAAVMQEADLRAAHLEGANLHMAQLIGADLREAQLGGATLTLADLRRADLRGACLDAKTMLDHAWFGNTRADAPRVYMVRWGGTKLTGINWSQVRQVGDETAGPQRVEQACAAYLDLANALQDQGVNEAAVQYESRGQHFQRRLFLRQGKLLRYISSLLFDGLANMLAGYGYKPLRTLGRYLMVISGFALLFYWLGATWGPPLTLMGALTMSVNCSYGRGFFPGSATMPMDHPMVELAAIEAVVSLVIEVTFIAIFTRRFFFGK
jgi:uncharacterized protein YjbI with pentapeptide repeats